MRRAAIQSLVAVVFVVLAEVGARALYLVRRGIPFAEPSFEDVGRIYDYQHPYLPVALKKHSRLVREPTGIRINNVGFRGPDVSVPKPPGSLRIAALGGSTTWGMSVRDADSWPRVVESELRRRYRGRLVEVINAGVPGYNTMEDLINLVTRVLPLEPDIVVEYQGFNDMKGIRRATRVEPDYSDWRNRVNPHQNFREILQNHSRLYFGMTNLASRYEERPRLNRSSFRFQDRGQVASFKRNLFHILALCRAHRISPILSTYNLALDSRYAKWRSQLDIHSDDLRPMLEAYNQQIQDLAREEGVDLADVERALPDDATIHTDLCHLTVAGNRRLAETVLEQIVAVVERRAGTAAAGASRDPLK